MKKLIALLLAVLVLAGMGTTAFADGPVETPFPTTGSADIGDPDNGSPIEDLNPVVMPILGTFSMSGGSGNSYHVVLSWEGLSFTYHEEQRGEWDWKTHKYGSTTPAKWTSGENGVSGSITVTNHSDTGVTVTITADMTMQDHGQLKMGFANNQTMTSGLSINKKTVTLESAEYFDPGEADSSTVYVLPRPGEFSDFGKDVQLGTITVSVAAAE